MFESILYLIALLLCVGSLCLLYRNDKEESLLRSIIICYVTVQCIISVFAIVMSILSITINIVSIMIIYFAISIWCILCIIKNKRVQRLKLYKYDLYVFFILGTFFILLFLKTFGTDIGIIYKNSDPGQHYLMALDSYRTGQIRRMYFSPLQNALFMDLLDPFMLPMSLYKAFILSDTVANFITVSMMYIVISTFVKNKVLKILTPVILIAWYMGWPFYSYIAGGYVYFGTGVMLFLYCIYLLIQLKGYPQKERRQIYLLICLSIYNISICYMLFTPIIAIVVIWYVGRDLVKDKGLSRRTILIMTGTVLLVGSICFIVCFYGFFGGSLEGIFSGLKNEGGIHRELYKDIAFLLFPSICVLVNYRKKQNVIITATIIILMTTVIAFFITLSGLMSGYYFYKLYYLIWTFLFLLTAMSIELFISTNKIVTYIYIYVALGISLISFSHLDTFLVENHLSISDENAIIPIYGVNRWYVDTSSEEDDLSSLRAVSLYISNNKELQDKVKLVYSIDKYTYGIWFNAFSGQESQYIVWKSDTKVKEEFQKQLKEIEKESEYFILLKTSALQNIIEQSLYEYKEVWEDDYIVMYQF